MEQFLQFLTNHWFQVCVLGLLALIAYTLGEIEVSLKRIQIATQEGLPTRRQMEDMADQITAMRFHKN